jgi:hypothetical protein
MSLRGQVLPKRRAGAQDQVAFQNSQGINRRVCWR